MEEDLKPIIVTGVDVSKCEFLTKTGHCKAHMSIMGIDTNKCECFPNCYFKQLTREKRECAYWKKANDDKNVLLFKLGCPTTATARREVFVLQQQIDILKEDNEKMSRGYAELTEIVSPYIDDFTGYNEKLGGFDIVLCVKELLQQLNSLKAQNDTYKKTLEDEEVRFTLNEVRTGERHLWFNKAEKLEQTLIEVQEIAENVIKNVSDKCIETTPMYGVHKQIIQKISEVDE